MIGAFSVLGSPFSVLHFPLPVLPIAVHISDGLLTPPWLVGGFFVAGLFALWGAWRVREEEVPRIALLTAAFFVASSIHVRVGPGSYHLLLSGLVGVVLGRRAALAIPIGLAMQAVLLNHGGTTAIGINSCVQVLPALLGLAIVCPSSVDDPRPASLVRSRASRSQCHSVDTRPDLQRGFALRWLDRGQDSGHPARLEVALHPIALYLAALLAGMGAWAERRMDNASEFPLGLLVGELSVLIAVALKCVVLILGGEQDWQRWALIELVGHLPIAVIEGIVLGFTVGFLTRVKPEMLSPSSAPPARIDEDTPCLAK